MADDVNPILRGQLMAALAVVTPELRGFHRALAAPVSPPLKAALTEEGAIRERRRFLLQSVIDVLDQAVSDMDALIADGYPSLPTSTLLTPDLLAELRSDAADLEAAVDAFDGHLEVGFDNTVIPTDVPQLVPDQKLKGVVKNG